MKRTCIKCGDAIVGRTKKAKFCTDSCRVAYHLSNKQSVKLPVSQKISRIIDFVPKISIWFALIIVSITVIPIPFEKCAQLYRKYEIGKQNMELILLKEKIEKSNDHKDYWELIEKYEIAIYIITSVSNPENGWMSQNDANQFEKQFKTELKKVKN